jgi:hypothetical protein
LSSTLFQQQVARILLHPIGSRRENSNVANFNKHGMRKTRKHSKCRYVTTFFRCCYSFASPIEMIHNLLIPPMLINWRIFWMMFWIWEIPIHMKLSFMEQWAWKIIVQQQHIIANESFFFIIFYFEIWYDMYQLYRNNFQQKCENVSSSRNLHYSRFSDSFFPFPRCGLGGVLSFWFWFNSEKNVQVISVRIL